MDTQPIGSEKQVHLLGLTGPYRDCIYLIKKDEFLIGRSSECDLILNETSISAKHARIVKRGDQYELQDLKSSNGTFVEGVRIEIKKLRSEDRLCFDRIEFRFSNPVDVSRTVIGEAPRFDAIQKTIIRTAAIPGESGTPPSRPLPDPVTPASSPPPQLRMEDTQLLSPQDETQPVAKNVSAPTRPAGNLMSGFFMGFVFAYLLGVITMTVGTFIRIQANLDAIPQLLRQVVAIHPLMHLHTAWQSANLKDAYVLLVAISLLLGLILGGLVIRKVGKRSRFTSAFFLALGYVLLSLLLQAGSLNFNFSSLLQSYPLFFDFLSGWGNFAFCVVYFFAVSLALSFFGTLFGRREK